MAPSVFRLRDAAGNQSQCARSNGSAAASGCSQGSDLKPTNEPTPHHREAAGRQREVVVYRGESARAAHDHATCCAIARTIAQIKGSVFAGEYDPRAHGGAPPYFVPIDTVIGVERARSLGIAAEDDLFGGVVPHAFVATKCISHPLLDDRARTPDGWSPMFGHRIGRAVLAGYSAFSTDDALRAASKLLARGPIRIKRALGIGGAGQTFVDDAAGLEQALADVDPGEVARYGIAIEEHLDDVTTHSVGQVRVDGLTASYFGTQRLTRNHRRHEVYGGSDLFVARGDFDALLASYAPAPAARRAIEQARLYDAAAFACFDGLFASRRNYDVAEGTDASGERRLGVLEQSWRVGGASGAEASALAAFRADTALSGVRATSTEIYDDVPVPPGASVYFDGLDDDGGRLVKYVCISNHVHA